MNKPISLPGRALPLLLAAAVDTDGIVSQRAVGIEVRDSATPGMQANLGCDGGQEFHALDSTIYNDASVAWTRAFGVENFRLGLAIRQHPRRGSAHLLHLCRACSGR